MKNKTFLTMIMTAIFIILLPLLIVEILIKKPNEIIGRIKLSFQLMLFVIGLSRCK